MVLSGVWFSWARSRVWVSSLVVAALASASLVASTGSARADTEQVTPVVGSFAVGGSVTAGVDERTGVFTAQVPLGGLPGVGGEAVGSAEGLVVI